MRNFKKAAAFGLAVTMLMGNAVTAFADEGSASGSGGYEGYVEETSVFSVVVPTAAAEGQFDFFVDPNGLLAETEYARMAGTTAANFETGASLFFTRTPAAEGETAIATYGKDSDEITFENRSSYAVNVEVSASVTGADGITLGTITDTPPTAPTIYLALVTPSQSADSTDPVTTAITADGATVTGAIAGVPDNFEIVYKQADESNNVEAGYYYEAKTGDGVTLEDWETYSFHLTGACGGTWTADQADVTPTVNLTWKVTDPNAGLRASGNLSSENKTVTITGIADGVTLTKAEYILLSDNSATTMTKGTHYDFTISGGTGTLTVLRDSVLVATTVKEFKLTFSDGSTVIIPIVAAS